MNVLFVCRYNVGRSQMAEAFFNKLTDSHKALSAGTDVLHYDGQQIKDRMMIKCMTDAGIDVSKKRQKQVTRGMVDAADRVVVLTSEEDCPDYIKTNSKVEFWNIEDAKGKEYSFFCKRRDEIREKVELLVRELG